MRVALVGCGRWGRLVLDTLLRLQVDTIVVDSSDEAQAAAAAAGSAWVTHELGAVAGAAGVVVATPTSTHTETLIALREYTDVPIFCEKPLCTSAGDSQRIARIPGRLFAMHVWRYHRGVELLGEMLRNGTVGAPSWIRSTRTNGPSPRHDVDPIWTLAPHDLSIAVELLRVIPEPRWAVAERVAGTARSLVATLGGDPAFVFEVSDRDVVRRREIRLHGDEASATLDADGPPVVKLMGPNGIETHHYDPTPPLDRELAAFIEHLGGGPPPKSDRHEGLAVVATLLQIRTLAGITGEDWLDQRGRSTAGREASPLP